MRDSTAWKIGGYSSETKAMTAGDGKTSLSHIIKVLNLSGRTSAPGRLRDLRACACGGGRQPLVPCEGRRGEAGGSIDR